MLQHMEIYGLTIKNLYALDKDKHFDCITVDVTTKCLNVLKLTCALYLLYLSLHLSLIFSHNKLLATCGQVFRG